MTDLIVHICSRQEWLTATKNGEYRPPSFETEGFIHCSRPDQVLDVANAFYRHQAGLVLLAIDPKMLLAQVRWEPGEGDQAFPHIYGPLNPEAVVAVWDFLPDVEGYFRFPGD